MVAEANRAGSWQVVESRLKGSRFKAEELPRVGRPNHKTGKIQSARGVDYARGVVCAGVSYPASMIHHPFAPTRSVFLCRICAVLLTRCSLLIQKVNCIPVCNGGAAWQSGDGSAARQTMKLGYLHQGWFSEPIKLMKIASVFVFGLKQRPVWT